MDFLCEIRTQPVGKSLVHDAKGNWIQEYSKTIGVAINIVAEL